MPQNDPLEQEKKLSAKQQAVVLLLANGSTIDTAARQTGCSEKTIDRWKHELAFMEAIRQAEDDIYNESLNLLKRTAKAAIICLIRNMDPKQAAPYVQVAAAAKLLEQGMEIHKVQQLEQRLAELEARLKE